MDFEDSEIRWRVESFLLATFGAFDSLAYLRSHNNHVYRAGFSGGRKRVIKIPGPATKPGFRREVELLKRLAGGPLRVPRVEIDAGDLVVLEEIPGPTLEAYARQAGLESEAAWRVAGRIAAQFSTIPIAPLERWLLARWGEFDHLEQKLRAYGLWQEPIPAILSEARAGWYRDPPVFTHADFGPGQILVSGETLCVIDWENAAAGSYLDPLARCSARAREYLPGLPPAAGWLVEGFSEVIPLNREQRRALLVREMVSHLSDASWKLGWQPDHHPHALAIVQRVKEWWEAASIG